MSADAEIGLCLLLAAADGEISDEELFALTTRIGHLVGDDFTMNGLQGLVDGELTRIATMGADAYIAALPDRIPVERRGEAIRAACKVACADGLSAEEKEMLDAASTALGIALP